MIEAFPYLVLGFAVGQWVLVLLDYWFLTRHQSLRVFDPEVPIIESAKKLLQ